MPTAEARCLSHNRRAVVRAYIASLDRPHRRFSVASPTAAPVPRPTEPSFPRPVRPATASITPGIKGGQDRGGRSLEVAAYALALSGAIALLLLIAFVIHAVAR